MLLEKPLNFRAPKSTVEMIFLPQMIFVMRPFFTLSPWLACIQVGTTMGIDFYLCPSVWVILVRTICTWYLATCLCGPAGAILIMGELRDGKILLTHRVVQNINPILSSQSLDMRPSSLRVLEGVVVLDFNLMVSKPLVECQIWACGNS